MVTELLIILLQHFNSCLLKQEASSSHFLEVFLRFLVLNLFQITQNQQEGTLTDVHAVAHFSRGLPPLWVAGTDLPTHPLPWACRSQSCCSTPAWLSLYSTSAFKPAQAHSQSLCNVYHSEVTSFGWHVKMFYVLVQKAWLDNCLCLPNPSPNCLREAVPQDMSLFYFGALNYAMLAHILNLSPNSLPPFPFVWGFSTSSLSCVQVRYLK